jgi:hypothetical protein
MAAQLEIDIDPDHQVLSDTGHASYSLGAWLVPNLPECRTMRARTR